MVVCTPCGSHILVEVEDVLRDQSGEGKARFLAVKVRRVKASSIAPLAAKMIVGWTLQKLAFASPRSRRLKRTDGGAEMRK
jgi:hypothetical protein